jgi:hypothetical protein
MKQQSTSKITMLPQTHSLAVSNWDGLFFAGFGIEDLSAT